MNGTAFINVFLLRFKWQNLWRPLTRQTAMEFIQNLPKPQLSKSNFCESYYDIPKYAQMEKVLVFRNMLRYEHMDEYGIGTDCIYLKEKIRILIFMPPLRNITVAAKSKI